MAEVSVCRWLQCESDQFVRKRTSCKVDGENGDNEWNSGVGQLGPTRSKDKRTPFPSGPNSMKPAISFNLISRSFIGRMRIATLTVVIAALGDTSNDQMRTTPVGKCTSQLMRIERVSKLIGVSLNTPTQTTTVQYHSHVLICTGAQTE